MKHTTTWHPDTCGCVVNLEWDDAEEPDNRTHKPLMVKPCQAHSEADCNVVTEENHRKNKAVNLAIERGMDLDEIKWGFDDSRVLHLTLPDKGKVASMQAECNKMAGNNKVKVV